ncbi:phosphate acetyltransferase [bacterium]|nr:phosphate acetyltransferase [bacterium]
MFKDTPPILEDLYVRAKANPKRVVMPEAAEDDRTLRAAARVMERGWAIPVLLGDPKQLDERARDLNINLQRAIIIHPQTDDRITGLVELYQTRRAKEGRKDAEVRELILSDPLMYGAGLVARGEADGMTAGAISPTASVIRAGLKMIGTAPGISTVSSIFLMMLPEGSAFGHQGTLIYADCGVVPKPDSAQLADIAISSARLGKALIPALEPNVAMLSFSTKGSAQHEDIDKVVEATRLIKEREPDLCVDGELQVDAAIVASVGTRKAPDSPVAGKANILVFPDLGAGNIAYKLTQRLAGAIALGPLLQGFAKPINDLSRGATANDVAAVTAITGVEAQTM